jgi:hypothetical protein
MKTVTRLVLVGATFSVFATSFTALAEDKKKPATTSAGQMTDKGGKTSVKGNAKDVATKGLSGKGGTGSGADGGVGNTVGDAIGGTVDGAVGSALGGFLNSIGH